MTQLPIAEWQSSLDGMETALGATLAALDRYQTGWESLLAEQASTAAESPTADHLEVRLREWDARLVAAAELAASVESELHDREIAVGRWHESFHHWHNGIKRGGE